MTNQQFIDQLTKQIFDLENMISDMQAQKRARQNAGDPAAAKRMTAMIDQALEALEALIKVKKDAQKR